MARGWRLTGVAWRLMRHDRTMIVLALLGAGFGMAGAAVVLYFGGYFHPHEHSRGHFALVAAISLYPLTFISVFFNVAFASAAAASFDGRQVSLREALGASWERLGRIALWSLLSAGVGFVLSQVASKIPGGGKIAVWLVGAAWGLATIFVIPLLALEDPGPIEALRGSAHLVKSRWGEGLTGLVGIGAWTIVAAIPAGIVFGVGVALSGSHPASGVPMIAVGLIALVTISALATATRQVFAVALFRYATDTPAGGFAAADLEHPFAVKQKQRRGQRVAYAALGVIVALVALAAILHPRRELLTDTSGYAHTYFPADPKADAEIRNGMPVVYDDHRIGFVIAHQIEGSEEYVRFYVAPGFRGLPSDEGAELTYSHPAHPYIRLFDDHAG
jgi:hypothetical protein